MTERCSPLVHAASGPPSLHYYCAVVVHSCILSATVQTTSIIVVNLQDNGAVFRMFIVLLRLSFDSPSCNFVSLQYFTVVKMLCVACCTVCYKP
jgi:hypothetical protein